MKCFMFLFMVVVVVVMLFVLFWLLVLDFWIIQFNYIGLFFFVVFGFVLLIGVGGLIFFGQVVFVGVGVYVMGYLMMVLGLLFWLGFVVGFVIMLVLVLFIGLFMLCMLGYYLLFVIICWCLVFYYFVGNLEVLGKYDGLFGLLVVMLGDFSFQSECCIYWLIWLVVLLVVVVVMWLLDFCLGCIMWVFNINCGGGFMMFEVMGVLIFCYKLMMFVVVVLLVLVLGWFYVYMQCSVNFLFFGIKFGIEYLFMVVFGGIGSVGGVFIGVVLVKLVED